MKRRTFLQWAAYGAAGWSAFGNDRNASNAGDRPNILWITCEDMSANLGCYGDAYASTPHLDAFAARSVRYTRAFAHAPVCAPARSGLITGCYPTSLGTQHMRSKLSLPPEIRCFPQYLREAGYYCSNNVKTDYNFDVPPLAWDESSNRAHWRNRAPGQPFFSVFNLTSTHEGQIRLEDDAFERKVRTLPPEQRHDPAKAPVPPFHPDTPEVRRDWARYYDLISLMDAEAGAILAEFEEAGLAENTIVFFFSDHGVGLPRGKRWLYDTGLHVPLMIHFPERWRHLAPVAPGEVIDRLVSFVDFAPTVLSLAGLSPPEVMQGQAFLGQAAVSAREFVFAARDRMDERYDMSRAVRNARFKYIRNYRPRRPHCQYLEYMYQMPTMQVWERLANTGQLEGPAALFMTPVKAIEELYDLTEDPHEIHNLAEKPEHRETLDTMRAALRDWMIETRDLGLLPEDDMYRRANGHPPATMARDATVFPVAHILDDADLPLQGTAAKAALLTSLEDPDAATRFWAVTGLDSIDEFDEPVKQALKDALKDAAPAVRIAAAETLARRGETEEAWPVLGEAVRHEDGLVRLAALQVLDNLGAAEWVREDLPRLQQDDNPYVVRVANHAMERIRIIHSAT